MISGVSPHHVAPAADLCVLCVYQYPGGVLGGWVGESYVFEGVVVVAGRVLGRGGSQLVWLWVCTLNSQRV